jgi:hypothetical protein
MAIFRCIGVVVQESAANCNAFYILLIVIASGRGYVGCPWLLFVLIVLLVAADQHTTKLKAHQEHSRQPQLVKQTKPKQPQATHITTTRGNNNKRNTNRITVSSRHLNYNTYTPEDGHLGQTCSEIVFNKRTNEQRCTWRRNPLVTSTQRNKMLQYTSLIQWIIFRTIPSTVAKSYYLIYK